MASFYYQHDGQIIGPLTGIDLREAAFAGKVTPVTLVAASPNGNWVPATRAKNLFDDDGKPLPHPPGVEPPVASTDSVSQRSVVPPPLPRKNEGIRIDGDRSKIGSSEIPPQGQVAADFPSAVEAVGDELADNTRAGRRVPAPTSTTLRYLVAVVACAAEMFLYAILGVSLGWKHGGGVLPMMLLMSILGVTWTAITKRGCADAPTPRWWTWLFDYQEYLKQKRNDVDGTPRPYPQTPLPSNKNESRTSVVPPSLPPEPTGKTSTEIKPLTTPAKYANASLVCGIAALAYPACITGPIGAIAAIILGVMGIKSEKRRSAIAGIALGCLALAVLAFLTCLEYRARQTVNDILQSEQHSEKVENATTLLEEPQQVQSASNAVPLNTDSGPLIRIDPEDAAAQEPRNPFQEFTAAQPDARLHYLRGLAAAQNQEDFESAVQHFTEAIRIDSDYAEAYVARGCVRLYNFDEHDLAIEDHTKAISLQPNYALAYFHRADTYCDEGRNYHEALNDCNKAISLAPRFAHAFSLRAQVLMELEEHEQARADLERAEQLDEDGPWYPWEDTSWQPWQEVTVPGVCKFNIPPTLEIQGGSFADLTGELRHGMFGPDGSIKRIVIQPRGLNEFKGKAFDTYARVIVEVSRNSEESGLRQEYLQALTPADLREADEVFKQQLIQGFQSAKIFGKEIRLLEWKPCRIVRLGNFNALREVYRRQLGDNPPVHVESYLVPIDNLKCRITVSYRESERSKWAADLEKVISSFEFEHRGK